MAIIRTLRAISILALLVPIQRAEDITINVHGNPQCAEDTDETPRNCTLDAGLKAAQYFTDPVTIVIQSGSYTLRNTSACVYRNRSDIQIVGQGSPVVNCLPGTGCSFYDCQGITIKDVTFIGCGAIHNSTSQNFSDTRSYSLMKYRVALYFELCLDVTMVSVNIIDSNGTGLVFLDSADRIRITDSWFVNNAVARDTAGGGGVYVEFSECKPGNASCADATYSSDFLHVHTSSSTYEFTRCYFINNRASNGGFKTTNTFSSKNNKGDHYVFGRGGGLLVYFKGSASDNSISIHSCEFAGNQANYGAGLFTSFSDESQSNSMTITATLFMHNECYKAKLLSDNTMVGGGLKINFGANANRNTFLIEGSSFINNTAAWAGGISMYVTGEHNSKSLVRNSANISGCYFKSNIATIGAAIDFLSPSELQESSFNPVIENCCFISNGGLYEYVNGSQGATCGTVYIERMPATFKGNISFEKNMGSALVIQSSVVHFTNNTTSNFSANVGRMGAAITFLGTSWMKIYAGTQFLFDSNTAVERGGAIYAGQTNEHSATYFRRCFIRYYDPSLPPWNDRDVVWESSFTFSNNTVTGSEEPNAIFASSILPCVWSSSPDSSLENDISKTFCNWSNWEFVHSNCMDQVVTSAGSFSSSKGYSMSAVPGWKTRLNVAVFDDYGRDVTNHTVFSLYFDNYHHEEDIKFQYSSDNSIIIYGMELKTTAIAVETVSNRNVYSRINVSLSICPPGFLFNASIESCVCPNSSFANFVFCKEFKGVHKAFLFVGFCISYSTVRKVGEEKMVILSRCPFGVEENTINPAVQLPENVDNLDKICSELKRTGKLCGECKNQQHGISVISGTFKCVKCDSFYSHLGRYFALNFVGPTVFFIIIIIFHIGVTSAPANGFIFFSQIITIPLKVLLIDSAWKLLFRTSIHTDVPHGYLTNILLHPYRLWSLDFNSLSNTDVCLNPHLKVIDVLAIRYVSAVYPVIVLIITYAVIELRARNCRLMVCLWKPCCFLCVKLRRKWQPKNSIINAFATFILLSYTKFIRVSITILTPSNVYNINGSVVEQTVNFDPKTEYFSHDHLPYAALAVIILATFGAIPPLLLLLYPFRWFQRCLTRCKLQSHALRAFVDAFQGCYKDGKNGGPDRRYFAGIYFIFRIVIFSIYTISDSFGIIFTQLQVAYVIFVFTIVILQPYKKRFYNILDGFFFAILAVTSGITMYMYTTLVNTKKLPKRLFYLNYALYFIPNIYMVSYVVYWLLMRSHWFKTHCVEYLKNRFQQNNEQDVISSQALLEEEVCTHTTSELPDRLDNPVRYESNEHDYFEGSWASSEATTKREMDPVTKYGSTVTY